MHGSHHGQRCRQVRGANAPSLSPRPHLLIRGLGVVSPGDHHGEGRRLWLPPDHGRREGVVEPIPDQSYQKQCLNLDYVRERYPSKGRHLIKRSKAGLLGLGDETGVRITLTEDDAILRSETCIDLKDLVFLGRQGTLWNYRPLNRRVIVTTGRDSVQERFDVPSASARVVHSYCPCDSAVFVSANHEISE